MGSEHGTTRPHWDFGQVILIIGVSMFLLFVVSELSMLLRPRKAVTPDPHDELPMSFEARRLQVGYITAILPTVALAARYIDVLVPVVLAISLLVPALAHHPLHRRADADE